jgi:hypothetical protein
MVIVDFTSEGNLASFRSFGWARPERHGAWMNSNDAQITITGLDPACDYDCQIHVQPFVAPPHVLNQKIVIKCAGAEVFQERFVSSESLRFQIPARAIGNNGQVQLSVWCPEAVSPRSLGLSTDARRLSFAFRRAELIPSVRIGCVAGPDRTSGTVASDIIRMDSAARRTVRPSPKGKLAAVTMVYNEREYLPIWLRHYARHVGSENCYVIDHGSDDGSTVGLRQCNVIRVPRSSYDPQIQSDFNSKFCSSLLCWYERVIYSDVDEILMPDPNIAATLRDYCELALPDVVTAIGCNIVHVPNMEPGLDLKVPVTSQRSWVLACASMCKPLLTNRDIRWAGGSHSADARLAFDHLYLFHLRWFDFELGKARLERSRAMAWAHEHGGGQARLHDEPWIKQFHSFSSLPKEDLVDFDPTAPPVEKFLDTVRASQVGREFANYKIDLNIWWNRLWKLPKRFVHTF